jgi:hypothetical protein
MLCGTVDQACRELLSPKQIPPQVPRITRLLYCIGEVLLCKPGCCTDTEYGLTAASSRLEEGDFTKDSKSDLMARTFKYAS